MRKITLNYDEATGMIYDATGTNVGTWQGLKEVDSDGLTVQKVIELKEAGFTSDEIIALTKERVL